MASLYGWADLDKMNAAHYASKAKPAELEAAEKKLNEAGRKLDEVSDYYFTDENHNVEPFKSEYEAASAAYNKAWEEYKEIARKCGEQRLDIWLPDEGDDTEAAII